MTHYLTIFLLNVVREKTYGIAKKKPIDNFLKSEEQFIYLRRYKEELKDIGSFFTDIEEAYPEHVFHVKGRTFYCDNKVMGYAVALSQGNMKKIYRLSKSNFYRI